jgi:hypothetical protein
MFYMGTDFSKGKAPFVWYDLIHVLDALSQLEWLQKDPRLQAMASILKKKADSNGRWTPESVWLSWKDWEFGQKKVPSRWLTYAAVRLLTRLNG